MIKIVNNTPLETEITVLGDFRLLKYDPRTLVSTISTAPPLHTWPLECVHILQNGPLVKNISFSVDRWSEYEVDISSSKTVTMTMGFRDSRTVWSKHTPGSYEWDGKSLTVTISCSLKQQSLYRPRKGPIVAQDIPLVIICKTENTSWKVTDEPITMVKYTPVINNDYFRTQQ